MHEAKRLALGEWRNRGKRLKKFVAQQKDYYKNWKPGLAQAKRRLAKAKALGDEEAIAWYQNRVDELEREAAGEGTADLTEGPAGMLMQRMTAAHMRAVNFARAHGISAEVVNAVIARLEAAGVPLATAGDLASNIFRMILTGTIDPAGAFAPAFSESALDERVARTVTMQFRNRRAADDFAEVLDDSPYPYYEDPDEPLITVQYTGDREREDIEMMASDFGVPMLTEADETALTPLPDNPKFPRGKTTLAGVRRMLKMNGFGDIDITRNRAGGGYYYFFSDADTPDGTIPVSAWSSSIYVYNISQLTYEQVWDEFARMYKSAYQDITGKPWKGEWVGRW